MSSTKEHIEPIKTYLGVFYALLGLTALTVAVAYINFGFLNTPIALGIASFKAVLVIFIFMHVRHSSGLTKLFIGTGFAWLLILFGITLCDYVSRDWQDKYAQTSWINQPLPLEVQGQKSIPAGTAEHH